MRWSDSATRIILQPIKSKEKAGLLLLLCYCGITLHLYMFLLALGFSEKIRLIDIISEVVKKIK